MLKQISVFLENKRGTLATATKVLADNSIDLIALSIADTTDFGLMRCIVNKPEQALKLFGGKWFCCDHHLCGGDTSAGQTGWACPRSRCSEPREHKC